MRTNNFVLQLSWSKINLFLQCPRCFYNELSLGIKRPAQDPDSFKLPIAVEILLKKEFSKHRRQRTAHPIMVKNNIEAVPFADNIDLVEKWKNPQSKDYQGGIRFHDKTKNLELFGGIDDIWVNPKDELIIVEYKTTAIDEPIILSNKNRWHNEYMKQVSFYAWLFKKNNYKVHNIAYFIFCNGLTSHHAFNQRLEFETTLLPYAIDDSWIEDAIVKITKCLQETAQPETTNGCKFCSFALMVSENDKQKFRSLTKTFVHSII